MTLQLNDCRTLKHPEFSPFEACTCNMSKVMSQSSKNTCRKDFKQVRLTEKKKKCSSSMVLPCGHFSMCLQHLSILKTFNLHSQDFSCFCDLVEVMRSVLSSLSDGTLLFISSEATHFSAMQSIIASWPIDHATSVPHLVALL